MLLLYVGIFLLLFAILYFQGKEWGYKLLVLIHIISFLIQFLICLNCEYSSIFTLWNILFTCISLVLIISPWKNFHIVNKNISEVRYIKYINKYLLRILFFNLFISAILGAIIFTFIPNIADFKADGYLTLYESIPYFSNVFRYAYTTQTFGYFAVPIAFYYLVRQDNKKAKVWFIASLSSLVASVAFFSRANMIGFILEYLFFYCYYSKLLDNRLKNKIAKVSRYFVITLSIVFFILSYSRFSKMEYLSERIPEEAIVQDITLYYLLYYAGQGFPYGINCLEKYDSDKCLNGNRSFYSINQILNFFGIIKWDSEDAALKNENVFGDMFDKFLGYTALSVYDLGYWGSFVTSSLYFLLVTVMTRNKQINTLKYQLYISLLVQVPLNSIFYNSLGSLMLPMLIMFFHNIFFKILNIKVRVQK